MHLEAFLRTLDSGIRDAIEKYLRLKTEIQFQRWLATYFDVQYNPQDYVHDCFLPDLPKRKCMSYILCKNVCAPLHGQCASCLKSSKASSKSK